MILKALEMQGFKSFADKTVFEFEKGITAVVGPNGSGKSNISDAIRWVLGEQSTKSLRGSKMEDVIFSGTGTRRAVGYAEVTLKLDNTDKSIKKYDTDTVSVTRRYYRSGDSEYAVNGKEVRLRDIHEMFMDTGLGRDGYSMVSQGKISNLISAKSNERREMFEEAAGISHYRYSRNDSLRKLSQAEENMVRLRDILTELEGRLEPLRVQSEKAEKFLVLAGEKRELEIGLWLHTIERAKNSLKVQEDKIALAENQYEKTENELSDIENRIEDAIREGQQLTEKIEEIRLSVSDCEERALSIEGEIGVLENSLLHNRQTIERILREKDESTEDGAAIQREISKCEEETETLASHIDEMEKELTETENGIFRMREKGGSLDSEAVEISSKIAFLTKSLGDIRAESQAAYSSIAEIEARIEALDNIIVEKKKEQTDCENELSGRKEELKAFTDRRTGLLNSLEGYRLREEGRRKRADDVKKTVDTLSLDIQRSVSHMKMLEELEKNMEGYSGAVKAVIREAEKGGLRGIHGALSQLIRTPEKYALAIETALGGAIQNIVTDNENDAKRAIELLKRLNAGRATFLPVTTVKGRSLNETGLEDCPGFVDFAVRLTEFDEVYRGITENLLGKTVVAENIDSAVFIGKKYQHRFKIVTLDGQVINAGGSMTGGSRDRNAGLLSRGTQIEKIKKATEKTELELQKAKEHYKLLSSELSAASAELEGVRAELTTVNEDIIRKEGEISLTQQRLSAAKDAVSSAQLEKQSCAERKESLKKICSQTQKNISSLSKQLEGEEKKLEGLGKLRNETALMVEEITKKATETGLMINSARKDMEAKKATADLLRERLEAQSGRLVRLEDEIESIEKNNREISGDIKEKKAVVLSVREEGKNAASEISVLQERRTESEGLSAKLRVLERSKTSERENISGELARLTEKKTAMLKEYDDTVNKLYDEYQLTRREAEALGIVIEEPVKGQRRLNELKSQIRALGSVNVGAVDEYKEVSERYGFMKKETDDIEKSKRELEKLIDELTKKMAVQFKERFIRISGEFSNTFRDLFSGGSAQLSLEDPSDVLESNIEIKVQPPGKNVQNIDLLSGGEKALSAIALLISIIKVNPAPFCIFDEVEAALDEVNVTRYAQYLRRMTESTQFVLITHRRGSMEEADTLYGVTMQEEGVSKLLELRTSEMAKQFGIE